MKCRFINSGTGSGSYNMAVDGALLRASSLGGAPPALRVYGWEPPAVSLGYFQSEEDFRKMPGFSGTDIVKRLTGGGAILHEDELTFSLVCREDEGLLPRDVFLSYGVVCGALETALERLGIPAARRGNAFPGNPVSGIERRSPYFCFEKPSSFDMVVSGRKLAGSAQRRSGGAVLHHGSVLLGGSGAENSISAGEAAGRDVSFDELSDAVLGGFREVLGVEFEEAGLSSFESELAAEFAAERKREVNREGAC